MMLISPQQEEKYALGGGYGLSILYTPGSP